MLRLITCSNKILIKLYIGLLSMLFALPLQAAQQEDIRVVIDVSGSMQKTDPENLRIPALHLINGLIPTGSKAGVWTFGRYVNMEVKWGTVNANWRKLADLGADKIHSRGQYTNIESALKRATKGWEKADPDTNRNLILLTDGKVDISKNAEKNAISRSNVLNKSIPELNKRGIKVHTIALSDQTDETLLKRLALKTSGSFEVAKSADDLQRIFLHMFERATKPDTVPIKDNTFMIDKSISEMTLLVFRKDNKLTQLIGPDNTKQSQSKHAKNLNWRDELGYDLITVNKPEPGKWSLDADVDDDNRVMIVTNLSLVVDELPAYMSPDEALNIHVELHTQSKRITKNSFLKFVDFHLSHKVADKTENLPLILKNSRDIKDKGIYLQSISSPLEEGRHEIEVVADTRTFTRSKRFSVEVQWPVTVEINKSANPGIYELTIKARDEYIKADSLQLDVTLIRPDKTEKKIEIKTTGNQDKLEIRANEQDGLHQLQIKMKAESLEGKMVEHKLDSYPVFGVLLEEKMPVEAELKQESKKEEIKDENKPVEIIEEVEESNDSDWENTLIFIVSTNVIIILVVVAVVVFIRKRLKNDDIDLIAEESDDKASSDEDVFNV